MELLITIDGELIRVGPDAAPTMRRRLLVAQLSDGAERIAVRVTSLSPVGCSISGPGSLADVDGRLWLKLPGFEAFQVAAIDEEDGKLLCRFAQPLSSAFLHSLANPRSQIAPNSRCRARCTLL